MKREILIITVLITNIAFGAALPVKSRVDREIDTNKNRIKTLAGETRKYLYNKGLDAAIAEKKVLKALNGNEYRNSLMAENIVKNFTEIKDEDIIAYIGTCALHERAVDFSSHEDIVALLQKKNRFKLDKDILEKVHRISSENKHINTLYRL